MHRSWVSQHSGYKWSLRAVFNVGVWICVHYSDSTCSYLIGVTSEASSSRLLYVSESTPEPVSLWRRLVWNINGFLFIHEFVDYLGRAAYWSLWPGMITTIHQPEVAHANIPIFVPQRLPKSKRFSTSYIVWGLPGNLRPSPRYIWTPCQDWTPTSQYRAHQSSSATTIF